MGVIMRTPRCLGWVCTAISLGGPAPRLAAQVTVAPPAASTTTYLGGGARLGVATIASDLKHWLPGASAITVYPDNGLVVFAFEPMPGQAGTWRGQVARSPFPARWEQPVPDLVADLPTEDHRLRVAFPDLPPHGTGWAAFQAPTGRNAPSRSPVSAAGLSGGREPSGRSGGLPRPSSRDWSGDAVTFYVRVVPTAAGGVAGPPSNTVTVTLAPGRDPFLRSLRHSMALEAGQQRAQAAWERTFIQYRLAVTAFESPVFEDPNRWGCIRVIRNPYVTANTGGMPHPLAGYAEGGEYCPPVDPATQHKDAGDWILEGLGGWLVAWQGLSDLWNGATGWVAVQIVSLLPCEELGATVGSACVQVATTLVDGALRAGLTAVGVPPTIPDLEALKAAARGQVVQAAVAATCKELAEEGGCTPLMEATFSEAYDAGLTQLAAQLATQAQEPQCGDAAEAKTHGLLPLPCFTEYPGTRVEPATGAVYQPPVAVVRVTRLAAAPAGADRCDVSISVLLSNYWPGGQVPGIASPPIPAKPIKGWGFAPAQAAAPPLAVGASQELRITLPGILLFDLIQGGNYGNGSLLEWYQLYAGSTATVGAEGFSAPVASPVTGAIGAPRCAETASLITKPSP